MLKLSHGKKRGGLAFPCSNMIVHVVGAKVAINASAECQLVPYSFWAATKRRLHGAAAWHSGHRGLGLHFGRRPGESAGRCSK